ncbi:Imm52 family immunity protein [Wielerella bovis]|uniref:Imm52 family immunity protein n=1 Tax=Wielerella bovis TaxID=2917790 RepID=UPI002019C86A|nr:Imm52 family immunity protein [Wielerella bovis]MCG7656621.1 Imm52 family immunity protein [Wielerella bovis]MCG7658846.1 Imm52 family immunity protein [Wielerella bovis]
MKKIKLIMGFGNAGTQFESALQTVHQFYHDHLQTVFGTSPLFARFQGGNEFIKGKRFVLPNGRSYRIESLNEETFDEYHDSLVEVELSAQNFNDIGVLLRHSEVHRNEQEWAVKVGNVAFHTMFEASEDISVLKKHENFFQISFGNTRSHQGNYISFKFILNEDMINKELAKKWLFYFINRYQPKINTDGIWQSYPNYKLAKSIYDGRLAVEWFTFLPAEILPEEVPSAHEVIYIPNCGSIIISTEKPYNYMDKQMRIIAANIEKELHSLGLLPIIEPGYSPHFSELPFITREQRLKNRDEWKQE